MKQKSKILSMIVVFIMMFGFVSSKPVYIVNADDLAGEIRYDFIETKESFVAHKDTNATSVLSAENECLRIDYTVTASNQGVGFKTTSFTVDRTLHNYINFRIKVPANVLRFRVFLLNPDGSVYTSWSNAENGMDNIAEDGEFHVYTVDMDNANTHATRPKVVADGTYSIRFDIMMSGATTETQTAYLDWLAISQTPYSSKPALITGAQVNDMTFDLNVGENGYTLCKDTAAYLTLDCASTTTGAVTVDHSFSVASKVTTLSTHKILDITVTDSNHLTASYRFLFVLYQKPNVQDLRWDFMNDSDTEGWKSKNQGTCPIKVEQGELNASTTTDRDAYFSLTLDHMDVFNFYRYVHFKARNRSATNTQVQVYLESGNFLHKNVTVQPSESDYSVYTLDLHEFINGSNLPLIEDNLCTLLRFDFYNVDASVTTPDGNLDLDWIVLSQSVNAPHAPAFVHREEVTYSVSENGRYRLVGSMTSTNVGSDGAEVQVYNNDKLAYQSYFPDGESGTVDVRILAEAGDVIKTKLVLTGDNDAPFMEWRQEVTLVNTVIPQNQSSTTLGEHYTMCGNEALLSSYLGQNKPNDVKIYTTLYGIKRYFVWDAANTRWSLTEPYVRLNNINMSDGRDRLEDMVWQNAVSDTNYVSQTSVKTSSNPTSNATTYIEIPIDRDGTIRVDGDFVIPEEGVNNEGETVRFDGELIKIYRNDELIWSNRVGGELSTRYDEPYDTKYFINTVKAVADVKAGDTLRFSFNRWRHNYEGENVDISNIKIKYVEGCDILSDSTVWKLKRAIIADVSQDRMLVNGVLTSVPMTIEDDDAYISLAAASEIFENNDLQSDDGYVPICETAVLMGKTPVWLTKDVLVIQDSAVNMFTWNETGEIVTQLEHQRIPDTQDAVFYSGGEKIKYLSSVTEETDIVAKRQVVIGSSGNPVTIVPIIALYNDSSLVRFCIGDEVSNLDGTVSEICVTLEDYRYTHGDSIRTFYWENVDNMMPILTAQEIN